ncbi:MAG: hypothetical protein LQ342_001128 [Letrouitia transgressa]|nr:MAG: hypothetical protein LQ342_001128 [Letrouitia transgressa]
MPGGKWEKPFYTPYALYGTIDYIYGWPAYEANNGFTAAQASMNVLESFGYCGYLWIIWKYGEKGRSSVGGGWGGLACLLGFSLSVMTFAKTVIYCFRNIGHNDAMTIIFLWIIPNGPWVLLPGYMMFVFGADIVQGLAIASGDIGSSPAKVVNAIKHE